MSYFSEKSAHIYFGDYGTSVIPEALRARPLKAQQLLPSFIAAPTHVIMQHQVHGSQGLIVDAITIDTYQQALVHPSDFLITQLRSVGLGVLTADCIPVVAVDTESNTIGIAHAGWKGSVARIVPQMIRTMVQLYGCKLDNFKIIFGPSARSCCYEVRPDFLPNLAPYTFGESTIIPQNGRFYFDQIRFNCLLLEEYGINEKQLITTHAACTICTPDYCSHRRSAGAPNRQMSIIWLD